MFSKMLWGGLLFLVAFSLMSCSYDPANPPTQPAVNKTEPDTYITAALTGTLYSQPVDPGGQLLLSSWLEPDGSNYDQYVWDNFTLQSNQVITAIDWFGVYDPIKFMAGGPVLDFSVSIYPSIAAGTEPAVAYPPLVTYQTGGNAGETPLGIASGGTLYAYTFILPTPFTASGGVKYWVQIEAFQHGTTPDWCLAAGSGGDGRHYLRTTGAGGDIMYRSAPGDAAFALLGPVPETSTPTGTATRLTSTPTGTATITLTSTHTTTPTSTSTAPPSTSTGTATITSTPDHTTTRTNTPTFALIDTVTTTPTTTVTIALTTTPTNTVTMTQTVTPTMTPTVTPTITDTPTITPTNTPTPVSNTPGKITGGGVIGPKQGNDKATFGFTVSYAEGDSVPRGNLNYKDHETNLRLSSVSFTLMVIDGTHAWLTGTGQVNDTQNVWFEIELDDLSKLGSPDTFYIHIPALDDYSAGGALTGGNITIHK